MSSHQLTRMIPVEFPQLEQDFRRHPPPHQPGATYTRQTFMVRSDQRVITIPTSISIPPNSGILAVVFLPLSKDVAAGGMYAAGRESEPSTSPFVGTDSFAHIDQRHSEEMGPIEQSHAMAENRRQRKRPKTREAALYHDQQQQQYPHHQQQQQQHYQQPYEQQQPSQRRLAMPDISSQPIYEDAELQFGDGAYSHIPMEEEIQNDDAYTNDADDLPVVTIMDETGAASTSITATSPMLMHASAMVEDDIPKPKKPRNSFFYFRRDYHKTSNAAGNRTRAKNISGAAGKIWKEMSDEKKAPYKELAAEDTKRYKQEMIDYKENLRVLKRQTRIREKDTAGGPSVYGSLPRSPLMGNSQIGLASGSRMHPVTLAPASQFGKKRRSNTAKHSSPYVAEGRTLLSSSPPMPAHSSVMPSSRQPMVFSFNDEGTSSGIETITIPAQSPPQQQPQQQQQQPAPWTNLNALLEEMGPPTSHQSVLDSNAFIASLSEPGGTNTSASASASHPPIAEPHPAPSTSLAPPLSSHTRGRSPANNQARRHNGTVVDNMLSIHPSIPDIEIIDASNSISLQKYSVKQRK